MLSVPMALVGGLLGLIYTGTTMNIVSMIGIVMLVGLVSKNAILLVDYTNTLRSARPGAGRGDPGRGTGAAPADPDDHCRTVIAMTPVALQIGRASEMRSPMAIVVIGGLLLSTLLTLLVIPVMYTYLDDLYEGVQRVWHRAFPRIEELSTPGNGRREERASPPARRRTGSRELVWCVGVGCCVGSCHVVDPSG